MSLAVEVQKVLLQGKMINNFKSGSFNAINVHRHNHTLQFAVMM